jgi:hypothetical protein
MVLTDYLAKFEIIDKRQFAYQKGKGVDQLFSDLSDYINTNLSTKQHTIAIAVDYSKAFDVLDHGILLKKLENIGIRGPTLKLFTSYLNNRKMRV